MPEINSGHRLTRCEGEGGLWFIAMKTNEVNVPKNCTHPKKQNIKFYLQIP